MDVLLTVRSKVSDDSVVQTMEGVLYVRDGKWFYHYKEPESEMGRVATILRLEPDTIRLLRQGDIRSEQQFRQGVRLQGYYDTAHGRIELDTYTHELRMNVTDGLGLAEWSYDLYVNGEQTSYHQLSVEISAVTR